MITKKEIEEIKELKDNLNKWNYEYYALNNPSVPDSVYDRSMNRLIILETKYPEYKTKDSPTVRVGGFVSSEFKKVKHIVPLLSLSNAFNEDDLDKFHSDVKKLSNNKEQYVIEPKIDGLSISLIYENSKLSRALTRGDGVHGEDVTQNILTIKEIPQYINDKYKDMVIEIRGEVFMTNENFTELNNSLTDKKFSNPRNAASGTLRNLDSSIVKKRKLQAYFYYMPFAEELGISSHYESIQWLKENKFKTSNEIKLCSSFDIVKKEVESLTLKRKDLNYQIDGVVIKVNDYALYDEIGYTSKFPKWAIAYKFPAEIGLTKLLSISTEIGRTGKITYVGTLEDILLDGSSVNKVSLNNYEYIKTKDIRINDYVYIYKAGDIIPYLDYVAIDKRTKEAIKFEKVLECPNCNSLLIHIDDDVDQRCVNKECSIQLIKRIEYFCSKYCMDIVGMSISTITKLFNNNIIKDASDLYLLKDKKETVLSLDLQIKDKSFNKLVDSIEKSKSNSLERLLCALSIRHLGKTSANKIAKRFKTIDTLISADYETLIKTEDVGEKLANEIIEFFNNEENIEFINKLKSYEINMQYKDDFVIEDNIIIKEEYMNKRMVITGTFSKSRNYIKKLLEETHNITFVNTVSSKIDFLLCGENAGSKHEKALELNINIIKDEFWNNKEN